MNRCSIHYLLNGPLEPIGHPHSPSKLPPTVSGEENCTRHTEELRCCLQQQLDPPEREQNEKTKISEWGFCTKSIVANENGVGHGVNGVHMKLTLEVTPTPFPSPEQFEAQQDLDLPDALPQPVEIPSLSPPPQPSQPFPPSPQHRRRSPNIENGSRQRLSKWQKGILDTAFKANTHPDTRTKKILARQIHLKPQQVNTW